MRKIFFFLIGFIAVLSCKAQTISFVKEYLTVKTDTSLVIAVPFKGKIFCLKSNSQILVLNEKTNQIDNSYSDNSKGLLFTNLYLRNDTLIGINKSNGYYLNNEFTWIPLKYKFNLPPLFEDDKFEVTSTCSGEWGGSIYFRNKRTNKIYESSATCAINVLKINNKYNITAALSHMSGFTNVFDVDNPLSLSQKIKKRNIKYRGDNESKSKKGTNQLVDSVGITAISSFIYNGQVFYLVTKRGKTFITNIESRRFNVLNQINDFEMWSYNPINRTYSNETFYSFRNDETSGFIRIKENRLTFYSFKWKDK